MPTRQSFKKKKRTRNSGANTKGARKTAVTIPAGKRSIIEKKAPQRKKRMKGKSPANKTRCTHTTLPELPQCYHKTYLRVLPKDPDWLFVYWEMSQETVDTVRNTLGDEQFEAGKPALRLCDITDIEYDGTNAWKQYDIYVHYYANNWYIKVPESGRTYIAEYGIMKRNGTFFTIMQSNILKTPYDNISEIIDEEWSTINTDDLIRFSTSYMVASFTSTDDSSVHKTSAFSGSSENFPADSTVKR
jgi:hypothetical protein